VADIAGADIHMMDETRWERVAELFDRLLAGGDPEIIAACEPDPEIREAAINLWRHHVSADREQYLGAPIEFEIVPIFREGEKLLNRFRIEKMLGSGGMGEVYLAWDERVEERVAVKTIARLLAPSPSIRKRFAAEVQSARRVTHPNVCRIHELFETGETVFFSMEYVDGTSLADLLAQGVAPRDAQVIVRQMSQALHAAHQTGVVHGDFKPANVMVTRAEASGPPRAVIMDFGLARALDRAGAPAEEGLSVRAGTVDYMAPELQAGGKPTVRSDIFAFGKVARQLLPKERMWDACTSPLPDARPESLEPIIRRLEPQIGRRYWVGGLAIASAGLVLQAIRRPGDTVLGLPPGARILVNGFRAAAGELPGARLARSVLLTALQQSPRLQTIGDEDLLPALRHLAPPGSLPLSGKLLTDLLAQLRAAFWIEGDLRQSGGRYSLDMRLLNAPAQQAIASSSVNDAPNVIALAQAAAIWVRRIAGESGRSLAANPADVLSYTSEVPEALQKYYEAMEHYAVAEMAQAIPLLQEAVRLDPQFAQAHHMLGLTIRASRRYDEAYRELEIAMRLADTRRLPERERAAIETNFYRMTEDPSKMIEAARRNVTYYPTEPRCYTVLGQTLVTAGNAVEGVDALRKAVSLAPDDWMHILGLEDALVEAGQFSQALDEFQAALSRGVSNRWIYNGAGAAYMGLERYDEGSRAFSNEPPDASNAADLQGPNIMTGHLEIAIAAMEEQRARARNPIEAHQANQYLCALYFVTDRPEDARRHVREMADLPGYPPFSRRLSGTASWARRLGDDETLAKAHQTAAEIAQRWPNDLTQAVEMHANALQAWRRSALDEAESLLLRSSGSAFNIWTLFDLAEFFTRRAKWELAEEYWARFEARRGTVLVKVWCPAIFVLGWLYRAVAAQGRNDRAKAFQYSRKVLDHWSQANPRLQVVLDARNINAVSKPL
jgi:serine/threonine protein kinase/Flp pilus assembly protein TadD